MGYVAFGFAYKFVGVIEWVGHDYYDFDDANDFLISFTLHLTYEHLNFDAALGSRPYGRTDKSMMNEAFLAWPCVRER